MEIDRGVRVKKKGFLGEVLEVIKVVLSAVVLASIIVQFVRPTTVSGESMYSTLHDKDYLLLNCVSRYTGVDRGNIIVFDTNLPVEGASDKPKKLHRKIFDTILRDDSRTKDLVKRVIALEGDHLMIKDGKVIVNEAVLDEPYVSPGNITEGSVDMVIPKNKMFVMGDNRMNSMDSRFPEVGLVDKSQLIGKLLVRVLPVSSMGKVK